MKIRILGAHNCESKTTKLTSLLVDDTIVIDTGGLTSSLSFSAQKQIKAILLTHQHYDHIRDVLTIAFNFAMEWATVKVYSTTHVHQALSVLLGNHIYPNFLEWPSKEKPAIDFTTVTPYQTEQIAGYHILPLPVNHSVPTVGYQVTSPEGNTVFYTGDTGPGLANCWERISPQLLITEVSAPNQFQELYQARGHLTPRLLKQELVGFRELKGYLPQVVIVHINPGLEPEIAAEIAEIARDLNHPVTLGHEGMQIKL